MKSILAIVAASLSLSAVAEAGSAPWCKKTYTLDQYALKDLSSSEPDQVLAMLVKASCSTSPAASPPTSRPSP